MSTGGANSPCGNCSKLLASHCMLKAHQKVCVQGSKFICEGCGHEYATKQGLRQHTRLLMVLNSLHLMRSLSVLFVQSNLGQKSMREHITTCSQNPTKKGPFFCHVEGCKSCDHPFSRMKNLNAHMAYCHGWKEQCQ